eukprot:242329-Hanusia_phi.AAC.2
MLIGMQGGGARLLAGTDTGAWGNVKVEASLSLSLSQRHMSACRHVTFEALACSLRCVPVQERSGEECAELHFTVDGFIFKSVRVVSNSHADYDNSRRLPVPRMSWSSAENFL